MTNIPHDAWVMVGDGEKALVFRNVGDSQYPNFETLRVFEHENPPTREQGSDAPGRFNDVGAGQRSAAEETDWHRIEKERFAHEVADRLYKAAHRKDFDKIVLVAPPRILGELRDSLHKEVADRVVGEISKTLTNHPVDQIETVITKS